MSARIDPIAPRLSWEVLDADDIDRIHEATLEILADVGIRFPSDKALTILEQNGCQVDRATQVAKLPREVVTERFQRLMTVVDESSMAGNRALVGTEVEVPNNKLKWDKANPTGHGVVFISRGGYVFCYVQPGGV